MPNFVTIGSGVLEFWYPYLLTYLHTPNFALLHRNSWSPLQQCKHYRAALWSKKVTSWTITFLNIHLFPVINEVKFLVYTLTIELMVKTGQFTTGCKGDRVTALIQQESFWWVWYGIVGFNVPLDTLKVISETKHTFTSEVMWQLMVLFPTGIARMAIYCVIQSHSQQVWFWHDFAGKGVLNVLGGVPPKWFLPF